MGGFIGTGIVTGAGLAAGRGLRTGSLFGPWRPPQWSKQSMVMITVPSIGSSNVSEVTNDQNGIPLMKADARDFRTYVFDAVFSLEHDQRLTKTMHPVQTGAALSSHAYLMPAHLTMMVGMSDAMQSYATGTGASGPLRVMKFTGDHRSKSISAYKQMLELQAGRTPLIITTRLRTYNNMLIISVSPHEDSRTIAGLRMRIEFEEIFTASVHKAGDGARINSTDSTGLGVVNAQTPDPTTVNQFGIQYMGSQVPLGNDVTDNSVAGWLQTHPDGIDLPGAGDYCSVNTNNLIQLPSPS